MDIDKTIAADAFAEAFRKNMAMPAPSEQLEQPQADVKLQVLGLLNMPAEDPEPMGLLGIDTGDFCTSWPKIKKNLDRLLRFAGFFMSQTNVGQLRVFVQTFEETLVPFVCQPNK